MKTKLKEQIKNLCSLFTDEYKEKVIYIAKIPFDVEEINMYGFTLDMITEGDFNIAPGFKKYYSSIYFLFKSMYEDIKTHDSDMFVFMQMFIDDIIPLLKIYYKVLKNSYIFSLEEDDLPPLKKILDYTQKVYFNLGEDVYKKVIRDILDFVTTANSVFEFTIVTKYPFLCSIDKPHYKQCIETYRNKIFYYEYNIITFIDRLCQKYLGRNISMNEFVRSIEGFKQLCEKKESYRNLRIKAIDFIPYFYINVYNNIFNNINVEELFNLLIRVDRFDIFLFTGGKEVFWYLNPKILNVFINTVINLDKINFNILEKMSNINIKISNAVCSIILYDIVVNEIRKNGKSNILFKICNYFDYIEQCVNIFSGYKYIPPFLKVFVYNLGQLSVIKSIASYLDNDSSCIYNYNLCDIYLNNSGLLYNIITSKKFFEMCYKHVFFNRHKRYPKYPFESYIEFENFIKHMKIIEQESKNVRFENFIVSHDMWNNFERVLDLFPLMLCFTTLPILVVKNNKNNVEYINKMFNNITGTILRGRIGSCSMDIIYKGINCYTFEIRKSNKNICKSFFSTAASYLRCSKRAVNCLIFMCLLYYFGIDLINDYILQNKIKLVFNKIDVETAENIFDILYVIYNNISKDNLEEIIDLSINACRLI